MTFDKNQTLTEFETPNGTRIVAQDVTPVPGSPLGYAGTYSVDDWRKEQS